MQFSTGDYWLWDPLKEVNGIFVAVVLNLATNFAGGEKRNSSNL
jgi:hypothetical protein